MRLHTDNLERMRKRGMDLADEEGTPIDLHAIGKPTTLKTYVSALVCLLREMPEHARLLKRYRKHLSQLSDHTDKSYDGSTLNARQQANWIDWEAIVRRRQELSERTKRTDADASTMHDHLLLVMYFVMAPARNNDCEMEIVRDKKRVPRSRNFYIVNTDGQDIMVLNCYKTSKHHGQRRVKVPKYVHSVVKDCLEKLPRRYLFA
ncbi:g8148 [Coccomyxa viridis]|uniref:G8148 protein n=1 Tax=Coccomyxa viridis TaxID=1274662 RepID=A0ABP1G3T1_9CHLO